jgi:hypothetical protein
MQDHRTGAHVVDLLRYREEKGPVRPAAGQPRRPLLAPVSPFRPLTPREVAHRYRMWEFLESEKSKVRSSR